MSTDVQKAREHWSSKIGFLFAAIGSAVGLGVLWKFPYTLGQNGGGLFLLSYVLCITTIGLPVFIGELLMGRRAQKAAIGSFETLNQRGDFWKLGGWLGVLSSFLIMSFYSVIAGWGMSYLLISITGFSRVMTAAEVKNLFVNLQNSGDICLLWHFIFTLITTCIVLSGVRKGIEAWSRIMTRALFMILLGLVVYSMTLPGFGKALHFVFYPEVSTFKFSSVIEALGLAFFTLSIGQGIMFSYGSYMKKTDNIPSMSIIVSFAVIIAAILGALTVFPVVFSFGFEPAAGTGLVFQTLPYIFQMLPGGQILSIVFFSLFVFCALTSAVAFVEVVASNIMELLDFKRHKAVFLVTLCTFIVGIPAAFATSNGVFADWTHIYGTNYLETLDRLITIWMIPIGGLITSLFIGWIWSRDDSFEEFVQGCKWKNLWVFWIFFMRWIIPILVSLIILQKSGLVDFDRLMLPRS